MMDRDEIAENELNVLTRLNHENVVKYFAHFEFSVRGSTGNKKIKLAILTEFCEVSFPSFFFLNKFPNCEFVF